MVAGAKVTAKNPATGLVRTTNTGESGLYLLRLPVGTYDVTIEAKGFRTAELKQVQLTVGSAVTLEVGCGVCSDRGRELSLGRSLL